MIMLLVDLLLLGKVTVIIVRRRRASADHRAGSETDLRP